MRSAITFKSAITIASAFLCFAVLVYFMPVSNKKFASANTPTHIDKCDDPVVSAVIYSLRTDPESWESDNVDLSHGNDVSIWIANADYGLNIKLGKNAPPGMDRNNMSDDCRGLLYQTIKTWNMNYMNEKLRG